MEQRDRWERGRNVLKRPQLRIQKFKQGAVQDLVSSWEGVTRVGIAVNTLSKGWDLAAVYAHFQTKEFSSKKMPEGTFVPIWEDKLVREELPWALHLDVADMEIGRDLRPFDKGVLRPHIGVRGAWMYQSVEDKQAIFLSGNYLGLGVRSGIDSFWKLLSHLQIFGHGSMSLIKGTYNLGRAQVNSPLEGKEILMAELCTGLQYQTTYALFCLGYEINYLFGKTKWADRLAPDVSKMGLSLQGITLGIRFMF